MKCFYDVLIVGASIAGLEAAKNLAGTKLQVSVVEKDPEFYLTRLFNKMFVF